MPIRNMADRREYLREYVRRPEVMARNNDVSKKKSKERKRKTTKKRLQEHTMEELAQIIKETCQEKNVEYESVREQYEEFMRFLHDLPPPQSELTPNAT